MVVRILFWIRELPKTVTNNTRGMRTIFTGLAYAIYVGLCIVVYASLKTCYATQMFCFDVETNFKLE